MKNFFKENETQKVFYASAEQFAPACAISKKTDKSFDIIWYGESLKLPNINKFKKVNTDSLHRLRKFSNKISRSKNMRLYTQKGSNTAQILKHIKDAGEIVVQDDLFCPFPEMKISTQFAKYIPKGDCLFYSENQIYFFIQDNYICVIAGVLID